MDLLPREINRYGLNVVATSSARGIMRRSRDHTVDLLPREINRYGLNVVATSSASGIIRRSDIGLPYFHEGLITKLSCKMPSFRLNRIN